MKTSIQKTPLFKFQTRFQESANVSKLAMALGLVLFLGACSDPKSSVTEASQIAGTTNSAANLATATSVEMSKTQTPRTCLEKDLAAFDMTEGEPVLLDQENLPSGLFLATDSQMLIQSKTPEAHLLVREVAGSNRVRVICEQNISSLPADTEATLNGLLKFSTRERAEGSDFTFRQFYFFKNKKDYGVVVSNPQTLAGGENALDLKKILKHPSSSVQLVRVSPTSYVLKYSRDSGATTARLRIQLEYVR